MEKGKFGKLVVRGGIAAVALGALVLGLYSFATLKYTYSSGERVGFVDKLSKRGWICKTHEGNLAMVNMPGQPAESFAFTVRDDAVVKQIDALAGRKVALAYEEHRGIPSSCFGDTGYFVVGVRKAE